MDNEHLNSGYAERRYEGPTRRYVQVLDLRDDAALVAEYRRLHARSGIWPQVLQNIRAAGVLEMEIYLQGRRLVMICTLPEGLAWEECMARLAVAPRQEEWERLTARFQQTEAAGRSDAKWQMAERIFHLYE